GAPLRNERVAEQSLAAAQPGKVDLRLVRLPPGRPGLAALTALGLRRAQLDRRRVLAGQATQQLLDLPCLVAADAVKQVDQHADCRTLAARGQTQGNAVADRLLGIAE